MSSRNRNEPDDDYFNDLSKQPNQRKNDSPGSSQGISDAQNDVADGGVPRTKRIACVICRKRKLKCDGVKPSCGTCARLKHSCSYDEVRRKSGPKRGYVRELETRLAQVETLLKPPTSKNGTPGGTFPTDAGFVRGAGQQLPQSGYMGMDLGMDSGDDINRVMDTAGFFQDPTAQQAISDILGHSNEDKGLGNTFSWEMIGLGLDEPLPTQDVIDDLHQIYFEKLHPAVPTLHKYRYLAAMNLCPSMRPPVCLRYSMWCLAAAATDKYSDLHTHFYQRARKYAEIDEMKGLGERVLTIAHSQTWSLISFYEYKMMYFPRAWMSTGRAIRLVHMMGLHRLDVAKSEMKQMLPAPRDWTEREERRRTFWTAYCGDRYASICTEWPMSLDNKDIFTNLPSTEDNFDRSIPQETISLDETLNSEGDAPLSSFGGVVVLAYLLGRHHNHVRQPGPDDRGHDLQGDFWKRHRELDNVLLKVSLSLPDHLRLPASLRDPQVVFLNMKVHTSTICIHQAAICMAEQHDLHVATITESRRRCLLAATEIANILRLISHIDVTANHPFMVFCIYVAARVIVQHQKFRPGDQAAQSSLDFLILAMQAFKRKNPLTESFLAQLDVDMKNQGIHNSSTHQAFLLSRQRFAELPGHGDCAAMRFGDPPPQFAKFVNRPSDDFAKGDFHGAATKARHPMDAINLASREQRNPQQSHSFPQAPPTHMYGDWTGKFPHEHNDEPLLHRFDTEMSSDQQTTSDQPTPNTSRHSSSNTSYSSPHIDDTANAALNSNPDPAHQLNPDPNPDFFSTDHPFSAFTPSEDPQYSLPMPGKVDGGGFETWRTGSAIGTPSAGTGLSPMAEGEWTQIMEGMGWDGGALGPGFARPRNEE